jgi:hypothetical protein
MCHHRLYSSMFNQLHLKQYNIGLTPTPLLILFNRIYYFNFSLGKGKLLHYGTITMSC